MTEPLAVDQRLQAAGITLRLSTTNPGRIEAAGKLTDEHRALIRQHRAELLWQLLPEAVKAESEAVPSEAWLHEEGDRLRLIEESIGGGHEMYERRLRSWLGALAAYEFEQDGRKRQAA
jgi:hypothetical protein